MLWIRQNMRRLVKLLIGVGGALTLIAGAAFAWVWFQAPTSNVGTLSFDNELHIPPLATPVYEDDSRIEFDLEFVEGTTAFLDGAPTQTWGLNGTYLSPTLRAARGQEVTVNVTNGVSEETTLHWHGMRLPAAADGGPHQMVQPGETWSPTWTIDQPASTLWFHPHLHGATAEHVYRGAAGMFIVDDDVSIPGLPATYGVDDIPVIVQDRSFDADNQFSSSSAIFSNVGWLGDEILVNGTHDPFLDVTTERVRLRVLNASNGRIYDLGFDDGRSFDLVGTDGGLMEHPAALTRLLLSPGERAEIVVTMSPGEDLMLVSEPPALGVDPWNDRFSGGLDEFELLQLRAADRLEPSPPLPDELASIDPIDERTATEVRTFALTNNKINGRQMAMDRIDHVVQADAVEIWEVTNDHGLPHSFHPHLVHFQILTVDGERPPSHLAGWKDTVYVPPGSTVRFIAEFIGSADPEVPFMFHCHILEHEDEGMMGQFLVVGPDQEAVTERDSASAGGHDH